MRPIRQALALDTLKSRRRPFPVRITEFGAAIVPELKLVQVPLQMLLAAEPIGAAHRALEVAEEVFDCVGCLPFVANIEALLVPAVPHRLVRDKFLADSSCALPPSRGWCTETVRKP
jgi:hypothetical protein